jgi:hypothetical protein
MESLPFTPTLARGSRGVSTVQKSFAALKEGKKTKQTG